MPSRELPPLYAIVDVGADPDSQAAVRTLSRLLRAGVGLVQIRAKGMAGGSLLDLVRRFLVRCRGAGVRLIINDRMDLALMAGADGVHLGATDLPVASARRVADASVGPRFIIGRTVRTAGGARRACAAGASYVSLGPMGTSRTKDVPCPVRSLSELRRTRDVVPTRVPVVAVGGITTAGAESLYRAGASSLAVSSALTGAPRPAAVVAAFGRARRRSRRARGDR